MERLGNIHAAGGAANDHANGHDRAIACAADKHPVEDSEPHGNDERDTHSKPGTYGYEDADGDSNAYGYIDSDALFDAARANGHVDGLSNCNPHDLRAAAHHLYCNAFAHADIDRHAPPDVNLNALADEYGHPDAHSDTHCHAASNIHVNTDPNEYGDRHPYPHVHSNALQHTHPDANRHTGSSHRDPNCDLDASAGDDQGVLHEHPAGGQAHPAF